jgi:hypothetical protein
MQPSTAALAALHAAVARRLLTGTGSRRPRRSCRLGALQEAAALGLLAGARRPPRSGRPRLVGLLAAAGRPS